jgi:probable HAF family extracellular repeat protein
VGQLVGSYTDADGVHGFLLSGGVYSPIEMPGALATTPIGINDAGQIVGTFTAESGSRSFLFSGGHYTPLEIPGSQADIARGINNAGQIVGDYSDGFSGRSLGFLATPVPESSTVTLLLLGMIGVLGFAGRGRRTGAKHADGVQCPAMT